MAEKLVYFLSDAHLGSRAIGDPRAHERKLVSFLDSIKDKAAAIYLLGDMFDFWFEYRTVVPKGHVRFLGKIAEIADSGVEVHFFAGNHDMWTFVYLADELGINVHTKPMEKEILGKKFFLAHGDGLNDNKLSVRIIQSIF
ncbi:MAG: UDP-2,3-diacylglucosamine diphosphatase, partial [Paludibacteraceae bacterium]|nr:UDP-2,3-diacylglucosamine diphosphatase [Paludibacteraceae bacterium]